MTNTSVMILNAAGHQGKLKASILCDRLVELGITHTYALVGDCHTVTVSESDVPVALGGGMTGYR